jgi:hypothetical protein
MNKFALSALSIAALGFGFSAPAMADTYLVVTNALDEPITLNGTTTVQPGKAAWTALNTVIRTNHTGHKFTVKDVSQKTRAGWRIAANGPSHLTQDYYIPLRFAEVGCLLTSVRNPNKTVPFLEMEKVALGNCSSKWYDDAGTPAITRLTSQLADTTKPLSELIASIAAIKKK